LTLPRARAYLNAVLQQPSLTRFTLYHLARRDGTAVFLHPFLKRGSMLNLPATVELEGFFGVEPRVESFTVLRNELYRRVDEDLRDWVSENRFIPRFLVASAAFLLVFLFLALVVHTPIPLVDELLGSTAAAAVVFILVGRLFEQSVSVSRRRNNLRAQIDNIIFTENPFARELEALFRALEVHQADLVLDGSYRPTHGDHPEGTWSYAGAVWELDSHRTADVLEMLRSTLALKPYRRLAREMKKGTISSKTSEAITARRVEPTLVHLYRFLETSKP
jgi:hypothetical protein